MKPARALLERFENENRRWKLILRGDAVVTAVSGGADSAALLCLLALVRKKYGLELVAAHLDHGFPGGAGAGLRRAAMAAAKKLDVPFVEARVDVPALARGAKLSLEDAGRRARYGFLAAVARGFGAKIATAHTLDDQAETVLLRLLRGAGVKGLAGIPRSRCEGKTTVIRPLLGATKAELAALVRERRLPFRRDPSNSSDAFARCRVRKKLLPLIEREFNPRAKETLAAVADACAQAQDFLDRAADRAFVRLAAAKKRGVALQASGLLRLHPALRDEILMRAFAEVAGGTRPARAHVAAARVLLGARAGSRVDLARGVSARRTARSLEFVR